MASRETNMAVPGYVLKNKRTTLERAEKFISDLYFTDCNLYGRKYRKRENIKSIQHYAAPGRIDFSQAAAGTYTPTSIGQSFGPTWSTHWFRLDIEIPESWLNEEVRLVWDSETEAMVWKDAVPLQGLTTENRRCDFIISHSLKANERKQTLYIEMACNKLFGAGQGMQIAPPDPNCHFKLSRCEIVVIDKDVQALMTDLEVLIDIVKSLPADSNRGYQALYTANDIVNEIGIEEDRQAYKRAREIAAKFFSQTNGQTQHDIIAVGNCHIDTAWLWPYDETKRKCARSFSAAVRLLEDHPEFTFACSQAAQFEWVKQHYPALYAKMKDWISKGRFIPVGGTWVEMDGYVPSGEAFIRQFLIGQRFFQKEFGVTCSEFWLPDTFGYSAQLPQIMRLVGIKRFVTQKISWNLVNKFPHHTFWWTGIDGSTVLAHFPPGDSYTMNGTPAEVIKTLNNFQDKGRSNSSLFLYGWGDGGQGPTEEIIERLKRLKDCDGLPRVKLSTPSEYFKRVEKTEGSRLCEWSGELYLELHNGTYTTQALVKKYNRKCEFLLRDLEAVCSLALVLANKSGGFEYPANEIERMWKLVLLNQFHDVLPGSSINLVYKDAIAYYEDVTRTALGLLTKTVNILTETSDASKAAGETVILNTLCCTREAVIELGSEHTIPQGTNVQQQSDGTKLVLVKATSFGITKLVKEEESFTAVTAEQNGDHIHMSNGLLSVVIDSKGRIVKLCLSDDTDGRNAIAEGRYGNEFVMFDDVPLYWDAWDVMDYHLETRKPVSEVLSIARIVAKGPVRAAVQITLRISDNSTIRQTIILDAKSRYLQFNTEVDWAESHKFLKVEFPLSVRSQEVTYEIQSGHLKRPTHFNTSWDWAKFEVCGHKWADVSEFAYGVAVLNDSKYGWSCIGNVLRLSLLRSPKAPDEFADMGTHSFSYAIMPHHGTLQSAGVISAAYELNNPLRVYKLSASSTLDHLCSVIQVEQSAVVLQAVKKAEDESDSLVLRFYESYGSHVTTFITLSFPFKSVKLCNALEQVSADMLENTNSDKIFKLNFKPFEIKSVLVKF